MFTSKQQLDKKTGPHGIGRFSYLQSLVTEFQDTDSDEAKEQVLANLANFAYDPVNYEYLRILNVIDLFLDCLSEQNTQLTEYSMAGICNLVLDRVNKDYILKNGGVALTLACLSSSNEETVVSAITTLMFLMTPESKSELTCVGVVDAMLRFCNSRNVRLSNLATLYLQDYCSPRQIAIVRAAQEDLERSHNVEAIEIDSHQHMEPGKP